MSHCVLWRDKHWNIFRDCWPWGGAGGVSVVAVFAPSLPRSVLWLLSDLGAESFLFLISVQNLSIFCSRCRIFPFSCSQSGMPHTSQSSTFPHLPDPALLVLRNSLRVLQSSVWIKAGIEIIFASQHCWPLLLRASSCVKLQTPQDEFCNFIFV